MKLFFCDRLPATRRAAALIVVLLAILAIVAACASDPEPTPGGQNLPPGVIPPYIFMGKATVAGQPVPSGIPMYARVGDYLGLTANTLDGAYQNILVGPQNEASGQEITFHLGDPDGASVRANETYMYDQPTDFANVTLDLSFPRLP